MLNLGATMLRHRVSSRSSTPPLLHHRPSPELRTSPGSRLSVDEGIRYLRGGRFVQAWITKFAPGSAVELGDPGDEGAISNARRRHGMSTAHDTEEEADEAKDGGAEQNYDRGAEHRGNPPGRCHADHF